MWQCKLATFPRSKIFFEIEICDFKTETWTDQAGMAHDRHWKSSWVWLPSAGPGAGRGLSREWLSTFLRQSLSHVSFPFGGIKWWHFGKRLQLVSLHPHRILAHSCPCHSFSPQKGFQILGVFNPLAIGSRPKFIPGCHSPPFDWPLLPSPGSSPPQEQASKLIYPKLPHCHN